MNLEEYRDSLPGKPENFAYFGDYPDFERYRNIGIGQHRDSEALDRSNFAVILASFENAFPDDDGDNPAYLVERSSNWVVGWSEGIRVDTENEDALRLALDWQSRLDSYPVADDEHLSNLETEERAEHWEAWGKRDILSELEDDDDLITLLDLDEDGEVLGFRDERAEELVRLCFDDYQSEGGTFDDLVETIGRVVFDYIEERRTERRENFEKYQLTILEV